MLKDIKKGFVSSIWLLLTLMGITAFTMKEPYFIVLGVMLISIGFLFFPWLDKLTSILKVNLNKSNKFFIAGINFLIAAYFIKTDETNYFKCIIPGSLMILTWVLVIGYKIKITNKNAKN